MHLCRPSSPVRVSTWVLPLPPPPLVPVPGRLAPSITTPFDPLHYDGQGTGLGFAFVPSSGGGGISSPCELCSLYSFLFLFYLFIFIFILFYFILKTLSLASKMYLKWYMTLNYENNNNYNNELFTLYKFSEVPI